MVRRMLIAFLAWLFFAPPAVANDGLHSGTQQEVSSILEKQQITLADLFRIAQLRNPALAAAENAMQAEAGRVRQAGLYPNPTLELEVEELSTNDTEIRKEKVSLVQPLVIGGRRRNAVAVASAHQEVAVHNREGTRREIYRHVHTLWAEQLYLRETGKVLGDLLGIAGRTLAIAETRFEAQAAPESHVTRTLLEVYELEIAEQRLTREGVRAVAELSALLGGTTLPLDRLVGTLDAGTSATEAFGGETLLNPAVRAAAGRLKGAEAALREARSERIPDLGVVLSYGRARPTGDGFIEAGLSIPLPLFNRNQGGVAESHALVLKAQNQMRIVENDYTVFFAAADAAYRAIRDELRISEERMQPAAEGALEQAQDGYRVGRVPFLELIDAQRTFSSIRLRNLELRRDLVIAEAELHSLIGIGPYGEKGNGE